MDLTLYSAWRATAPYRVRIGLALKGVSYDYVPIDLIKGEQREPEYRAVNPQGLTPALDLGDGHILTQSLAILEWLEETRPDPAILPKAPLDRAAVRAMAGIIACDIHPLNNTRVLKFLEHEMGVAQAGRERWIRHWIALGLAALEELIADDVVAGEFCHGDAPTMADATLIPQLYNARRWGLDLAAYPTLARIESACLALDAFERARPERQADAPVT